MNEECIKLWLRALYANEIEEVQGALENEKIWADGFDGDDENPHLENIESLTAYIEVLQNKIKELDEEDN